jgi:hypothetical protein
LYENVPEESCTLMKEEDPPLKASRDCILVISDGRLFQSRREEGVLIRVDTCEWY